MAIDTAQKRRSAAGLPFLPNGPSVTPNVSKDAAWRAESAWGYSGILVDAPAVIAECFITIPKRGSIAAYYFIMLRNVDGTLVAVFDSWIDFSCRLFTNDVFEGTFVISGLDSRTLLFSEDARLEIYRSVPGAGLDWYRECTLLVDGYSYGTAENGERLFVVELVGLNDFIRRREIAYKSGTVRADKDTTADIAIHEYVSENAAGDATTSNGRLVDGVTPNLYVNGSDGSSASWAGSLAGQNLLSSIKDIADYADIDFEVVQAGDDSWVFTIYPQKFGSDRTNVGLNSSTGKNAAGNIPVYFSIPFGFGASQTYRKSRRTEANTMLVWGKGERSTQKVVVRTNSTGRSATKYNIRELSVSGGSADYEFQLNLIGDSELVVNIFEETFQFTPLQQVSSIYGKHYFRGDRIMVIDERTQEIFQKRIIGVNIEINGNSKNENLTFEFE